MKVDIFNIDNKYSIIYADPPWDYSYIGKNFDRNFTKSKNGFAPVVSAKDHYNTMTNQDIMDLPLNKLSEKNCLLFIWITNPLLDIGFEVIKAWGFTFKTVAFVWNKIKVMPGFYTMSQVELCFVAKKGNIPKPRGARNIKQYYEETRGLHSRKPNEFRNRIEQMFPEQKKIELFARKETGGLFKDERFKEWDIWGNET
jgi:N6-adenosine-specific RNA methylase IME4